MAATATLCPRCQYERIDDAAECARCGVVFAKLEADNDRATATRVVEPVLMPVPEPGFGAAEVKMFGLALIAAIVANALPFVQMLLGALATLFHESGHAAASWLLGHPAIPAFDFAYGGGFTHEDNFKPVLAVVIGAGWIALATLVRRNPKTLALVGCCALLWLAIVVSEWRREVVIAAMGHAGELILATTFVVMALAGVGWRVPKIERPLGAFAGCFVQIHTAVFAWKLGHDAGFREWYLEGKGGALMNDLESIALDLHIHTGIRTSVEGLAAFLLFLCVASFALAPLLVAGRRRLRPALASFLESR